MNDTTAAAAPTAFYAKCTTGAYDWSATDLLGIHIPSNTNDIAQGFRQDQLQATEAAQ